jgi:hypothetical protein
VDTSEVQRHLLQEHSIRIGPHMGQYLLRHMRAGASGSIFVIGGDARTGLPVRREVHLTPTTPPPTSGGAQGELFT